MLLRLRSYVLNSEKHMRKTFCFSKSSHQFKIANSAFFVIITHSLNFDLEIMTLKIYCKTDHSLLPLSPIPQIPHYKTYYMFLQHNNIEEVAWKWCFGPVFLSVTVQSNALTGPAFSQVVDQASRGQRLLVRPLWCTCWNILEWKPSWCFRHNVWVDMNRPLLLLMSFGIVLIINCHYSLWMCV